MTSLPCESPTRHELKYVGLIDFSAHQLRERGWVVPAYTMAPHCEKMKLMRIVVREDFSRSRCDALLADFKVCSATLVWYARR